MIQFLKTGSNCNLLELKSIPLVSSLKSINRFDPDHITSYLKPQLGQSPHCVNYLENLALLKHFSGDVEGQIFGVNHTLDKVEILWHELLTVLHDEHTPYIPVSELY